MTKFRTQPGGYKKFTLRTPWRELAVIFWRKGAITPEHNHNCKATVFLLFGILAEHVEGITKSFKPGQSFSEGPGVFHQVSARHCSISFHIYGAPLIMQERTSFPYH
jgi:quercetin dioxygenase-like cupin family protein